MTDPLHWTPMPHPNGQQLGSVPAVAGRNGREHMRVLELSGEYDIATVDELQAQLSDGSPVSSAVLVIDLTDVTFLDARCTGRLLTVASERPVVVVGASGIVERVLDLVDPDQHLARRRTLSGPAAREVDQALGTTRSHREVH